MKYHKEINGRNYYRFRHCDLWIETETDTPKVYSYDTLIGYIDFIDKSFFTWGYGTYSRTTSKQITTLCNTYNITRRDIPKIKY